MDAFKSISDFFYNLIPGALFLLAIRYLYPDHSAFQTIEKFEDNFALITLIALSLGIGFLFQGLTKIVEKSTNLRKLWVYDHLFFRHGIEFENAEKFLFSKLNLKDLKNNQIKKLEIQDTFYLFDNSVRSSVNPYMIHHFSTKAALWFNLFWANFFLSLICIFKGDYGHAYFLTILIIVSILSGTIYLRSQYDSTMKMFLVTKHKNFRNKN